MTLAVLRRSVTDSNNARDSALRTDKAKDQFLAMLSHELRTPLAPALMAVTVLESDVRLPEDVRDDLSMIRRNVELELMLVDDLLDVTRITNGKLRLHFEPVAAHALLREVVEMYTSEIQQKRLRVEWRLDAGCDSLSADAGRLTQVFWNLLRNSIKFTPEAGTISFASSNDAEGRLVVRVSDSGVGIASDMLPRVFDAFEQGRHGTGTAGVTGLGLGLLIARSITELHGGSITAQSEGEGLGATFTVVLPSFPNLSLPVAEASSDNTDFEQLRILLVDDHRDTAKAISRLLVMEGHSVASASTVADALSLAAQAEFDLVISDIGLPDASGLELMRELRVRYNLKGIALTGYGGESDRSQSREAGFLRHLVKPVSMQQLKAAIRVAGAIA